MTKISEQQQREMARRLKSSGISALNDVLFKFVFGSEKRKAITIDFLSALLSESDGRTVKDLSFIDSETRAESRDAKLSRFDVACVLDTGETIDIEVQVANEANMLRRTLYYWAKLYVGSLRLGDDYQELKPVSTVNILGFNLLEEDDPYNFYRIYNHKHREVCFSKDLTLHFIEIPKYRRQPRKPAAQQSRMERWMSYFAGHLSDQEKQELADAEPGIAKAFAATDEFLRDQSQRMAYISRELELSDYTSNMNAALRKGEAKGRAEGRVEGRAEGIQETENRMVLNLLKLGTDINQISTAAGWSVDQTLAFARKHNLPVKQ